MALFRLNPHPTQKGGTRNGHHSKSGWLVLPLPSGVITWSINFAVGGFPTLVSVTRLSVAWCVCVCAGFSVDGSFGRSASKAYRGDGTCVDVGAEKRF